MENLTGVTSGEDIISVKKMDKANILLEVDLALLTGKPALEALVVEKGFDAKHSKLGFAIKPGAPDSLVEPVFYLH